jgi:hypothetical protein
MILVHHQYLSKTEKKTELILCHTREEADVLFERLRGSEQTIQVEMLLAARVRDFRSYTDVPDSDHALLNAGVSNSDSATLTHPNMAAAIACASVECGFHGKKWFVYSMFTGVSRPFDPNGQCFISDMPMLTNCMLVYVTLPTEPFTLGASESV